MNPAKTVTTFKCADEFTRAMEVLGHTVFEIEKMYDIKLPLMFNNEILMVEIESERATVCCLLDQNLLCFTSHLFCGDNSDLAECMEYCNANYTSLGCDRWAVTICCIEHIPGKEPCLVFVPENETTIKISRNSGGIS